MAISEIVVCQAPFTLEAEFDLNFLRQIKESGATSVQIYTFWKDFEPNQRGVFDWEYMDKHVRLIKEAGLKYVPFILIGPKYAAPTWWLENPRHKGLVCLEHRKESPIESIWNPEIRVEIDRVLQAFAEHYLPWDVLESVQPGICGDYGESIMPVIGNWAGDYHTHNGYWCGGDDAAASFRGYLADKYCCVCTLNEAWRTAHTSIEQVSPFLPHKAPSRTALFDMLEWYKSSMTEFVDFWMKTTRKHFPDTSIYMCTGGNEEPEHASNFSEQARVCGKYNGGIRLTNEGNRFFENFFYTSYTHSACEYYGAYLGLEPVGPQTPEGVAARMFGSAVYGNKQMMYYYDNIYSRPKTAADSIYNACTETFIKYLPLLNESKTECDTAFFWPCMVGALGRGIPFEMQEIVTYIRKRTTIMPINDYMIADGALDRYKLLIIPMEVFTHKDVALKIAEWVKNGGKVFAVGQLKDIELEDIAEFNELFGIMPYSELGIGNGTQNIVRTDTFLGFKQIGSYTTARGWLYLHDDTTILANADYNGSNYSGTRTLECASAFMREHNNGGAAIFYNGPLHFEYDAQDIFAQPPIFPTLLSDILTKYTSAKELNTQEGEDVRGYIQGKLYALHPNGSIEQK